VQQRAWSEDTITLLAACAVQFRRDWYGMPWWADIVDVALGDSNLRWAQVHREVLVADPRLLGADVLQRLVQGHFRYAGEPGIDGWIERTGLLKPSPEGRLGELALVMRELHAEAEAEKAR
jgi:hypothetical protein